MAKKSSKSYVDILSKMMYENLDLFDDDTILNDIVDEKTTMEDLEAIEEDLSFLQETDFASTFDNMVNDFSNAMSNNTYTTGNFGGSGNSGNINFSQYLAPGTIVTGSGSSLNSYGSGGAGGGYSTIGGNIIFMGGAGGGVGSSNWNQTYAYDPYLEIEKIRQEKEKDEELRRSNPSLQEAWENYQLIKKLVEDDEIDHKK